MTAPAEPGPDTSCPSTAAASREGPLATYRARVAAGEIRRDPAQELAAEKLQSLHNALRHYRPESGPGGWKVRLGLARRRSDPPQGLYMFGGVGRGKSMLMDAFAAQTPVMKARRVHFHAFMTEVHDRLHAWRQESGGRKADPLPALARDIAAESWLLCFDEFHVVNVADAMILSRLFEGLFDNGVVVVATSNFPPDRLYEGGLQRERFLPFIDLLKQRLDVLQLDSGTDYRLAHLSRMPTFHIQEGDNGGDSCGVAGARAALDEAFAKLTEGATVAPDHLHVKGRRIPVPACARGVARFDFDTLCAEARGAEDYAAIATQFHTVLIDGIPVMGDTLRNEARRFMTLIDMLYEHRCNLVATAAAAPDALYAGHDGAFEFQRTVSRLVEMQTPDYIARRHLT